jgi:hypothetical protein
MVRTTGGFESYPVPYSVLLSLVVLALVVWTFFMMIQVFLYHFIRYITITQGTISNSQKILTQYSF